MANSKAISIRIPDELLEKIDLLAEEKYKSHKGTPNRSLVVLDAIVAYFATLSDTDSSDNIASVSDSVSIIDFNELRDIVNTLSDTVKQLTENHKLTQTKTRESKQNQLPIFPVSDSVISESLLGLKINSNLLGKRLGFKNPKSISTVKVKFSDSKFPEFSAGRDIDGIPWQLHKEGKNNFFIPAGEPSDELKSKLLKWIEDNQPLA
jgi:metal-responsive CopG/Arc/MetJ family transcriptional regulator